MREYMKRSEYISRDAAISKIRDQGVLGGDYDAYEREEDVVDMLNSIPAADVVERKVGHWIFHPEQKNIYGGKLIECSECRTQYLVMNVVEEIYCRHCGSKNQNGGQET